MKNDADTIRNFLLGLLEYFSPSEFLPSGKVDASDSSSAIEAASESIHPAHPRSAETLNSPVDGLSPTFTSDISTNVFPLSDLGELPAVQEHFQAALKRRLQVAISQNPPLFPWESSLQDYPVDLVETRSSVWLAQARSLSLPTALPEDVLTGLLNRCQEILRDTLQPGVQLVKAVESLFPDQPQAMEQIAGLVLANATMRSTTTRDVEQLRAAFPAGYEGANPQQQVTLTMLAAKDILAALTLSLSSTAPTLQRTWLTDEGDLLLSLQYHAGTPDEIAIAVQVPQASQLSLPTVGQTVTQNRPGTLHLSLTAPEPNVAYPLEVRFHQTDSVPLTFVVRWLG